jgi:hypothetical protein
VQRTQAQEALATQFDQVARAAGVDGRAGTVECRHSD